MPTYVTDIKVIIENAGTKSEFNFENEKLEITRATKLWIDNANDNESEFYETIKQSNETDKRVKSSSNYYLETSKPTPVQSFRKYYVEKVDEKGITFEWVGN